MTRANVRRLGAAGLAAACLVIVVGQATADNTQTLTVDGVTVDEAAGTANFVVKLSAGPDDATFNYATADGSAKAGSDYTSKSDTDVTVTGGGQVIISVPVANDDLFEGAQSFTLNITNIAKAVNTTASATGNITDNDPAPVVTVTPASTSVTEGNPASVTLSLANKSETAVTVNYAKQNQTAGDSDYTLASGSRTWNPGTDGAASSAIQATTANDTLDEDDENFRINYTSTAQLSNAFTQVTITDNNNEVTVASITDATVTEGNTGTVDATVTVTLSAASGKQVTVPWATAPLSASEDVDYEKELPGSTLVFAPGQTSRPITVKVKGDTLFEGDEKFSIVLTDPTNGGPGPDMRGEVTITDDDSTPTPTVNNPSVAEGNSGLTDLAFDVTMPCPRAAVTFNYRTVADTANASDFTEVGGAPLVFNSCTGTTSTVLKPVIKVKGDTLDELNESFKLELVNPTTGAVVRTATGTITNDDNNSKLSINDASADEPGTMTFTVTLSAVSGREVKVNWATADGTATAGADYTSGSGGLTFAPGEVSKTIAVAVLGDALDEANETLSVNLSSPTGIPPANVLDGQGLGTIVDKNAGPSLSISDTIAREGTGATFTVTLAGSTLQEVKVNFNTTDGTAKAGSDYSARTGALTFAPGEKSKTIAISIVDDTEAEPVEEFFVVLGDPVNAAITKNRGEGSIEASDRPDAPPTTNPNNPNNPNDPTNKPPVAKPASVLVPRMILGPRTVSIGANGLARMLVTCQKLSPIGCAGSVELQRATKPLLKLGKKTFTVKKGTKGYASIKLNLKTLKLLQKNGTMRAKVIVLVKTSTKTMTVSPGIITLKATRALKNAKLKPPAPATKVVVDP